MDLRDWNRLLNIATSVMIQSVSIFDFFMSLKEDQVRACWNNRQDIRRLKKNEHWFKAYAVVVRGLGLISHNSYNLFEVGKLKASWMTPPC